MDEKPRAKFSDIVGALVASIANARNVADLEALRIAHRYRKNELLKGLPVPRLRLQRVSISLPVIVSEVISSMPAERNDPPEIARKTKVALDMGIKEALKRLYNKEASKILTEKEKRLVLRYKRLLEYAVESKASELFQDEYSIQLKRAFLDLQLIQGGTAPSDIAICDAAAESAENAFRSVMSELCFQYVQKRVKDEEAEKATGEPFDPVRARRAVEKIKDEDSTKDLIHDIRQSAESTAITKPTEPPDFYVSVDTDSIKNAGGGPDVVTRLNMVLFEEGLEWLTEVKDGTETTKLMPE